MALGAGDAPGTGLTLPVYEFAAIALGDLQLGVVKCAYSGVFDQRGELMGSSLNEPTMVDIEPSDEKE